MSTISVGTGLFSGIDIAGLVDALINAQGGTVRRLQSRVTTFQSEETAIKSLEANVLSMSASIQQLGQSTAFNAFQVDVSDSSVLQVSSESTVQPGLYQFQAVRKSATHQAMSQGLANADQQTVGAGTLQISSTGALRSATLLDALNGGNGVRRGSIRVTDRSGSSATIDLSNAYSVDDVLDAINGNQLISVTASTYQGRIILTDTSGGAAADLSVAEVNGGRTATDLGIDLSVNAATLTGNAIFNLTGDFTLDQINDGNGLYRVPNIPDLRITLTDDSVIEVNLSDAATINDVVSAINGHVDNGGNLQAALVNGRLELTDLSGGGGSSAFSIQDVNNASVTRALGLDVSATGNQITGRRLLADIDSVLLNNLRGGQGIDQMGSISLTDRTGATAIVDLTNAESLNDVLYAINTAQTGGGTKLQLEAQIDDVGTGLLVRDTSGAAVSNLIIADVGNSTLATQLGIAADTAQNSILSGSLNHRGVNRTTRLTDYAPDGGDVARGSFLITDSSGNQESIQISSSVQTLGDVLVRINAAQNVSVRAELNDTGDGFVLIDEAGGSGSLQVAEIDSTTAADLRILGQGTVVNGNSQITSRRATIVQVDSNDTLNDVAQKINAIGGFVTARVVNDGSAFNAYRLALTSTSSGSTGRFLLDSTSANLHLATTVEGQDALLRVGSNVDSGFLVASNSNTFQDVVTGLNVEVLAPSASIVDVNVNRDTSSIKRALQGFVDSYNTFRSSATESTKFDPETNERGVLQGAGIVLRVSTRIDSLLNRQFFGSNQGIRSLADLGVSVGASGKLSLDSGQLDDALQNNFSSVFNFFQDTDKGFASQFESALDSLTDPFTGTFALEENSLQQSVETLNRRIDQLNAILELRQKRLMRQFIAMEQILGTLNNQQNALSRISSIGGISTGAR